ncbi:hypothetical protein BCV70DRAFT_207149 [Testicularia cyperi]|uniref:Uncharacterized protein n=1 Tax=Testicularia cyperi TaxID=1882483 RepID=A0A317XM98_9BASI|nr:hypothetical protein BCV70DRAFT_207149 [Testicularia cyperi]
MTTDHLVKFWRWQVAVLGIVNQAGWDILIPVYESKKLPGLDTWFEPNKLTYIAIQIKNKTSNTTVTCSFGPTIVSGQSRVMPPHTCLEIFVDLQSPVEVPVISQRVPAQKTPNLHEKQPASWFHITCSGFNASNFPLISKISADAQHSLLLPFGFASPHPSLDPLACLC